MVSSLHTCWQNTESLEMVCCLLVLIKCLCLGGDEQSNSGRPQSSKWLLQKKEKQV